MKTILVICKNHSDFRNFVRDKEEQIPRPPTNGVIVINNKRYVKVSNISDLCGQRCNVVTWTTSGFFLPDFNNILTVARLFCLTDLDLYFKFGR